MKTAGNSGLKISGSYQGINFNTVVQDRRDRGRIVRLKWSSTPGEWHELAVPRNVTNEPKLRAWAREQFDNILALGAPAKKKRGGLTVGDLFDQFLEIREASPAFAGATVAMNRTAWSAHIKGRWESTPVLDLERKRSEIRQWVRELAGKVSPGRVGAIVLTFRTFLDACRLDLDVPLRFNPLQLSDIADVMPAQEKKEVVTLSVESVQALLDSPHVEYRKAVRYAVAVCTGASDGELAGARIRSLLDLHGAFPRLEIVAALKLRGKRKADGTRANADLGKPKNDNRMRAIPLNECASAALRDWVASGWEHFVGRPPSPNDPLFPSRTGAFSRPAFARLMRTDLESAGQPKDDPKGRPYEFRALRRTFSTVLKACKVELEDRERLMGEGGEGVIVKLYTAEVPAALFDAVRRLPWAWRRRLPWVESARKKNGAARKKLEPAVGIEPTTARLRSECSTAELSRLGGALGASLGGAAANLGNFSGNLQGGQRITKTVLVAASAAQGGKDATSVPRAAAEGCDSGASGGSAPKLWGTRGASAWALTFALEGVLARADHRANAGRPPRAEAPLAQASAVAVAGPVPTGKRVRNVG